MNSSRAQNKRLPVQRLFNGDRNEFPNFCRNLRLHVRASKFSDQLSILFFDPQFPLNDAGNEIFPDELLKTVVPPQLNAGTYDAQKNRRDQIRLAEDRNRVIGEIYSEGNIILHSMLVEELKQLIELADNPRQAFQILNQEYGSVARTNNDDEAAFWKIFLLQKNPETEWNTFLQLTFDNAVKTAAVNNDKLKRILLLSTRKSNPFKFQLLDDRFL